MNFIKNFLYIHVFLKNVITTKNKGKVDKKNSFIFVWHDKAWTKTNDNV